MLQERERRAELVARIRDEAALAREAASSRSSIALSVSPRRRISSSRRRQRQPLAQHDLLEISLGAAPHRLHRPQRSTRDEVPRERGEQERERPADEEAAVSSSASASSRSSSEAPATSTVALARPA